MDESSTPDAVQQQSDALGRVSDGVVSLDSDLRYTYFNESARELLDADPESLRGEYIWDVPPEALGTTAQDAIERADETGQLTTVEQYNHQRDRWWKARIHPDETGITVCITEVAERTEQLYEPKRADTVFQNTQDGLFIIDVEDGGERFRVNRVNQAFERLTGVSVAEIQGKTIRELLDERESASVREKYTTCVRGREAVEYEEHLEAFDSGSYWETRIAPVTVDGEVTQIVGSTRNVTDLVEREQELRRKTRALDKAPVGISITNPLQDDNPMTYVNEAFSETTGYDRSEAVGRNCRFLQGERTDPEQVAKLRTAVEEAKPAETTLRNYRKDGTPFWNQLSIAPVRGEDGALESFVGLQKDITDQKKRERRLQTHELVVQAMNEVAFLVDEQKRIQLANDAARDFVNEPPEMIEGLPIGPVIEGMAAPEEDPRRFLDAIDAVLNDAESDVGERIEEPNGSEVLSLEFDLSLESESRICVEQRFVPVEHYDGTRGVAIIARDITAQKETEQTTKTHLEQAQNIGTAGTWRVDLTDNTTYWSDECYRVFGIQPDRPMTTERVQELVHPEDRERFKNAWETALDGEPYEIEHRVMLDDEVKWVQQTAEITFDSNDEPLEVVGIVKDITDRREREREITEQKRRYKSLFNSVSGAVVVTDLDGQITTCNPGFTDLFGYDSADIEGTHLSAILDENTDLERLLETTDTRRESLLIDYEKNSGQVFAGESRSSPLRTHSGDTHGYVMHIVDVSEAEQNREQLQVLSRVFRHNVKNDMNVIRGHAEIIKNHGPSAVLSNAEKILETSKNFVEMAENHQRITELLTNDAKSIEISLSSATREVVYNLQREYPAATVQIQSATDCWTRAARGIDDAIRELVQNAIVHSDQERPNVEVELEFADGMVELTIRDDGPGIPTQESNVLTADGEINPLNHGTGLGLWFVKRVIYQSNGTLSFGTAGAEGTSVTMRLPATRTRT